MPLVGRKTNGVRPDEPKRAPASSDGSDQSRETFLDVTVLTNHWKKGGQVLESV